VQAAHGLRLAEPLGAHEPLVDLGAVLTGGHPRPASF
jgi:hypothetical protein